MYNITSALFGYVVAARILMEEKGAFSWMFRVFTKIRDGLYKTRTYNINVCIVAHVYSLISRKDEQQLRARVCVYVCVCATVLIFRLLHAAR